MIINKTHASVTAMLLGGIVCHLIKQHFNYDLSPEDGAIIAAAALGAIHYGVDLIQQYFAPPVRGEVPTLPPHTPTPLML